MSGRGYPSSDRQVSDLRPPITANVSAPDPTAGERECLPDAMHLCSVDCPEPCPHVWYPAFLPVALRVLSYDSWAQRWADVKVGWDFGPEQGAWLRALADALTSRDECAHKPEHVTSDGVRWPLICDACCPATPDADDASEPLTEAREWVRGVLLDQRFGASITRREELIDVIADRIAHEAATATKARADERERIAQAIEALPEHDGAGWPNHAYEIKEDAARIARGDA